MSFFRKLFLFTTLIMSFAVVLACLSVYYISKDSLLDAIDKDLVKRTHGVFPRVLDWTKKTNAIPNKDFEFPSSRLGTPEGALQLVDSDGKVIASTTRKKAYRKISVDDQTVAVAQGEKQKAWLNQKIQTEDGTEEVRTYLEVVPKPQNTGWAVQAIRSLDEPNRVLNELKQKLAIVSILTLITTAFVLLLLIRKLSKPFRQMQNTMDKIRSTKDLTQKVKVSGNDEFAKLAQTFNKMLEELYTSNERQTRFVADASHELRTPITVLRTNIELLKEARAQKSSNQQMEEELIEESWQEIKQLSELIHSLLEISKEKDFDVYKFDLNQFTKQSVENAHRHFPNTNYKIIERTQKQMVLGNEIMLERAFHNLLQNASQWTDQKDKKVEITIDHNRVCIRDFGPGIEKAKRRMVWQRFYRADEKRGIPGSGLGLSMTKQMVEKCGGKTSIEDPNWQQQDKRGICFCIELKTSE